MPHASGSIVFEPAPRPVRGPRSRRVGPGPARAATGGPLLPLLLSPLLLAGCAAPRLAVRPLRYAVHVRLDPGTHTLAGETAIDLERARDGARRGAVEIELHPDLRLESVEIEGRKVVARRLRPARRADGTEPAPSTHRLMLDDPPRRMRLVVRYRGRLQQDPSAGEREGEVHNLAVSAHIGEEGVYLGEEGHWYPAVRTPPDSDPQLAFSDYELSVEPIEGFELVAGLEREEPAATGTLRWRSPFPLDRIVLLGGPLARWSRLHGDVELHAVLDPGKERVAEDILDAAAEYLDRYRPLIGPYPYREFTVLEAFFSSGFAFPTCTQIVGSQLSERKQYRRHGYLDHELLHNWWGNGVFLDPRDGNWCEALATYMGNYYGYVLDGDEAGARRQRRDQSNLLSAIEPEEDKPLGTFGLEGGAGRGVGYMKGAAVFHMLERRIGAEALFAGLRRLAAERMGKIAGWEQIREAIERESGEDLGPFFEQWVRRAGAPRLALTGAEREPGAERVKVSLTQGATAFSVEVPLRLWYEEGRSRDVVVTLDRSAQHVWLPCETGCPTAVELDPDYHVFRKLAPREIMPTSALTRRAAALLIVLPDGPPSDPYLAVAQAFERAVLGEGEEAHAGHEVLRRTASDLVAADLARRAVLILGDAVRHPLLQELLERTRSPVRWVDGGFEVEGDAYTGAGHAILLTVHHPDRPEDGVTVYYGNDTPALANARLLSYYPNSLLVFETPLAEEGHGGPAGGMPATRVIRRMDFEFHDRIDL